MERHEQRIPMPEGGTLALLAASFAAALACGREECELQTLINFFSMVDQNLVIIKAQRRCGSVHLTDNIP